MSFLIGNWSDNWQSAGRCRHSGLRLCIDLSYNPLTMQEQLGDIGEDLGLAQPSPAEPDYTSQPADDVRRANKITCLNSLFSLQDTVYLLHLIYLNSNNFNASKSQDGKDIYAGMQTLSIKKDQEEPEFMRKWKEEQQKRLSKKDEEESVAMEELKLKAKQELADW